MLFLRNKFNSAARNEARFSGDGFISLDTDTYYSSGDSNIISMSIRPEVRTALLFFMKVDKTPQYISLELLNGLLHFKFSVQGTAIEITSTQPLEMGRWYTVKLARRNMVGELSIDGEPVSENGYREEAGSLQKASHIFVGGLGGGIAEDRVVTRGYVGCMADLKIGPDNVDLHANLDAENVEPTCVEEPKNTLSFVDSNPGYVKMPSVPVDGRLTLSLQFKTGATQGILVYMASMGSMYYVSLSMLEGVLHLHASPNNELRTVDTDGLPIRFNDNAWHTVSIYILNEPDKRTSNSEPKKKIFLQVDDFFLFSTHEVAEIPLVTSAAEPYSLYYGGLPENLRPLMSGVAAHEGPFIGCIRDAVVVDAYQNFKEAESMAGASLGGCGSADFMTIMPTEAPTEVVPVEPEEPEEEEFDPRDLFGGTADFETAKVAGECKLPYVPAYDSDLSAESGMRFGMKPDSFIEYVKKSLPKQMKEKSRFDLEFKTYKKNGLLLFMKDTQEGRSDFFALFINNGRLVFSFDCGSGPSRLATDIDVNDGAWHSVDISRIDNEGKMVVDNVEVKVPDLEQFSFSNTKILEVSSSLFLGGLDDTMKRDPDIKRKLGFGRTFPVVPGFVGCLRKVRFEVMRGGKRRMRPLGKWQKNHHVIPCSEKVEPGYFFGPEGGRIMAFRRFRVGIDFDVNMWIKPRNTSGLLLAVRGQIDMVILQMIDGAIQFSVNNGKGFINAIFKPEVPNQFCNGEWHEIHGEDITVSLEFVLRSALVD